MTGINDDGTPATSVNKQNNVELVVYTSDLKAETLTLVPQLFPGFTNKPIRIYDDNLDELREYYDWAKENHLKTLEIIRVRHDQARRRKKTLTFARPVERTGQKLSDEDKETDLPDENLPETGETIYDTYVPYPEDVLPFPDFKEKSSTT